MPGGCRGWLGRPGGRRACVGPLALPRVRSAAWRPPSCVGLPGAPSVLASLPTVASACLAAAEFASARRGGSRRLRRPTWPLRQGRVPRLAVVNRIHRWRPAVRGSRSLRALPVSRWTIGCCEGSSRPALSWWPRVALPSILLGRTLARPDWWADGREGLGGRSGRRRAHVRSDFDGCPCRSPAPTRAALDGPGTDPRRPPSTTAAGGGGPAPAGPVSVQEMEPAELWADFSGLIRVALSRRRSSRRSAPAMEPDALVSYLAGVTGRGQREAVWVVVAVPLSACILPAAVLVLSV